MELVDKNFHSIVAVNTGAMLRAVTGPPAFFATIHNLSTILVGLRFLAPPAPGDEAIIRICHSGAATTGMRGP